MDLEQRVQVLEKEVELLKSEIQALLLDMQEYLLSQAHPELRGENPVPQRHTPEPEHQNGYARTEQPHNPTAATSRPQPTAAQHHMQSQQAPVRSDVQVDTDSSPTKREAFNSPTLPAVSQVTRGASLEKLEEWTMHKLKRHGSDRTRELLNRYMIDGSLDPEQYDGAMRIIERYGAAADKMHAAAIEREARNTQAKSQVKPPRTSIPQRHAASQQPDDHDDEPAATKTNLVLRLIAGVHNAGIGIGRRTDDG
jgi:hypothetical protein